MRKSPIFKQPAVYNSLSYLSCSDCKEDVPISTKYLNEMKKAGAVKCPFCRSTNVIELSVVEWGERCYKRVGKNMPRRTDPRIKQIQPFKWEVASRTKIQYSYIVELHPGDVWICNCKGFVLSCCNHGTDCIHIKMVKGQEDISRPYREACVPHTLQL